MDIFQMVKDRKLLLAAHRGSCGGNIPCNSMGAFKAAIMQKADIVELDVEKSLDGELFIQHPGMEKVHLRMNDSIKHYPSSVVEKLVLSNSDLSRTEYNILRFEEAMRFLKGKCIVNIDKFWENPELIANAVRKLDMADDVIIKCYEKPEQFDDVEKYAPDLPLMVMVKKEDNCHKELMSRNVRYIGKEVLFKSEDDPIASKDYLDMMHRDGKLVWANAIVYNYKAVLSAGHTDDISVTEDPELGWGWLADHGFDIIQTDYMCNCRIFLEQTGRKIPTP